jgi:hypothetical protein
MAEQRLPPPTEGPLLPWLVVALKPVSRTKVKEWLTAGRILVNGKPVTRHDHALTASDRVTVGPATAKPKEPTLLEQGGLTVLYTDASSTSRRGFSAWRPRGRSSTRRTRGSTPTGPPAGSGRPPSSTGSTATRLGC